MNLLIVTQKVDKNDSVLGFFHGWILEFAKHCEKLTVICLEKGEYDLPDNVKVLSLGKEDNVSKFVYLVRFYRYILQYRKQYNNVFVHMNPEYVILGVLFWKLLGKKVGLWYMHKSINWKLKLAEKLTTVIFTGSKESFRLNSKKLKVLHHGIDSCLFEQKDREYNKGLKLLTVGRISKIKRIELMIDLVAELRKVIDNINLQIIGEVITYHDQEYMSILQNRIIHLDLQDNIEFVGVVNNTNLPYFYHNADIFLNFSETGSVDKAILEAMSCGTLVLTSNKSMCFLPEYFFCKKNDIDILQDKIMQIFKFDIEKKKEFVQILHDLVTNDHSLSDLIKKILKYYEKTSR